MRRDRKHLVSTKVEKLMVAVKNRRTVSRGCRNVLYCVGQSRTVWHQCSSSSSHMLPQGERPLVWRD